MQGQSHPRVKICFNVGDAFIINMGTASSTSAECCMQQRLMVRVQQL